MPAPAAAVDSLFDQYVGHGAQALMKARFADEFKGGDAGDHRHRIAGQRPCLIDGTQGRELLHDIAPAAKCADGHAAADDLAERAQVRAHAVQRLRAAQRDAKARHDFVEYQQRTAAVALAPQRLQKIRCRRNAVHVAGHRLDDDAGDLRADLTEYALDLIGVVVVEGHGVAGERLGHARRGGHAERQRTGTGLDQQGIGMAVIAALELHDGVAAGEAAGQTNGAHGRLGARTDEAHQFDGRHEFDDAPRKPGFQFRRGAEAQTVGGDSLHRFDDPRMRVAQNHRAPGADEVDEAPTIRSIRRRPGLS